MATQSLHHQLLDYVLATCLFHQHAGPLLNLRSTRTRRAYLLPHHDKYSITIEQIEANYLRVTRGQHMGRVRLLQRTLEEIA
jgi:hypothetical protein